jgi:hypothetical protein
MAKLRKYVIPCNNKLTLLEILNIVSDNSVIRTIRRQSAEQITKN